VLYHLCLSHPVLVLCLVVASAFTKMINTLVTASAYMSTPYLIDSYSEDALAYIHLHSLDRDWSCEVVALGQLNGSSWGVADSLHLGGACFHPLPFNVIPEALLEVEHASCHPK